MTFGVSEAQIGDPRMQSDGAWYPTLVLKVTLQNQAAPQPAPAVAVSARYSAPGQVETAWGIPFDAQFPFWVPDQQEASTTHTGSLVHVWEDDADCVGELTKGKPETRNPKP